MKEEFFFVNYTLLLFSHSTQEPSEAHWTPSENGRISLKNEDNTFFTSSLNTPFTNITNTKIYVYSVFYEPKRNGLDNNTVVAIGVAHRDERRAQPWCQVIFNDLSEESIQCERVLFNKDSHGGNG